MSLHVDRYEHACGESARTPLLLIHGWGMHGGMWQGVAEKLAQDFSVYALDLPGHGYSTKRDFQKGSASVQILDDIVDALSVQFKGPLNVCGWSLGGQLALRWASRHSQQVERLIMVASTPCFVRLPDWKYALSVEILEEFAANLQQNYSQTLRRFLSLQMRGSEQEREILAVLREGLFSRGEPDLGALQAGLEILRGSDLRLDLPELQQEMLVLEGERDTMIPHQATRYLSSHAPRGRLVTIRGAAHAPFLSHPDEFVEHVVGFLNGNRA